MLIGGVVIQRGSLLSIYSTMNLQSVKPKLQIKKQETVYLHASLREKQEVSLLLDVVEDLFYIVFQWIWLQEKQQQLQSSYCQIWSVTNSHWQRVTRNNAENENKIICTKDKE